MQMKKIGSVKVGASDSVIHVVAVEVNHEEWQARVMLAPFHVSAPGYSGQPLTEEQARGFFPELSGRTYLGGVVPVAKDRIMIAAHKVATEDFGFIPERILIVAAGPSKDGSPEDGIIRSVWSAKAGEAAVQTIAVIHAELDEADAEWLQAMRLLAELEEAED